MYSSYKIRVTRNEWQGFEKARLQISVGQPYHEGDKFLAAAEWIASNFNDVRVNLCDSLQRHNLAYHGFTPFQAFDRAIAEGDAWMERNKYALSILPNLTLTRWESWKTHDGWFSAQQKTKDLYEFDESFKQIVEDGVQEFWARKGGKEGYPLHREADFKKASSQYLLEEVAVSMIMSEKDIAEIYPGTFPKPLYYLRDKGIPAPLSTTSIAFIRKTAAAKAA